jgi:Rrf2 family protein
MRQLSKRTQYSLRALYALARAYGCGPILISQLAQEEAIPKKFLEQILSLKTRGLVSSKTGRGGGIHARQPPSQITLASVIRMIDGPIARFLCQQKPAFGSAMNVSTSTPVGPAS